jgi:hypothetical protein
MPKTAYFANAILNHVLREEYLPLQDKYVGFLSDYDVSNDAYYEWSFRNMYEGDTENANNGYVRVFINPSYLVQNGSKWIIDQHITTYEVVTLCPQNKLEIQGNNKVFKYVGIFDGPTRDAGHPQYSTNRTQCRLLIYIKYVECNVGISSNYIDPIRVEIPSGNLWISEENSMSDAKSNYLENKIIDHVLRNTAYTPPATVYVALFTSACSDAAVGTEVSTSGTGYSRKSATFNAASGGSTSNSATVDFGTASGTWGTVSHFAIMDASTGGNHLYYGGLTTPKTIQNGDAFRFNSGSLTVTEQ